MYVRNVHHLHTTILVTVVALKGINVNVNLDFIAFLLCVVMLDLCITVTHAGNQYKISTKKATVLNRWSIVINPLIENKYGSHTETGETHQLSEVKKNRNDRTLHRYKNKHQHT